MLLIADHLDRILAAGEDLTALKFQQHGTAGDIESISLGAFVHDCRELELAAMAAVIRAREHAKTLARAKTSFAPLAQLFVGGTAPLCDVVTTITDHEDCAFDGEDPLEFLRSRGLIDSEAGCLMTVDIIPVTEEFLLAGCIHLGTLMDMSATFLNALDVHFSLFPQVADVATIQPAPIMSPEAVRPRL